MFASQIDDWSEVVVDAALRELWADLDAQCDPVWLAARQAAIEVSLARQLVIDPDDGSAPLSEETQGYDEYGEWYGSGGPSDDGAMVLADQVAALRREVARTRALLAGAVTDRDDAAATVEAVRSRLHRGGITVTAVPGGATTWTTPTGRSYTTRPEPLA